MSEEKKENNSKPAKPVEKKNIEFTEHRDFPTVTINVSMPKVEKPKEPKQKTSQNTSQDNSQNKNEK